MAKKTTKKKAVAKKPPGRPQTLTVDIAKKFQMLWRMAGQSMTDAEICGCIGVTETQLEGWISRPQVQVDIGNGMETLRKIRTKAKSSTKTNYLQGIHEAIKQAKNNQDPANILKGYFWLLEKQFPNEFGNRQKIEHLSPVPVSIDDKTMTDAYNKIKELEEEYKKGK